jgi:hypothetical protein
MTQILQVWQMSISLFFTIIGYIGTSLISASYVFALMGYVEKKQNCFFWLNLLGGVALCFPTFIAGTMVTHVLNGFWIIIAASGLVAHYSQQRWIAPGWFFKCLAFFALLLLGYFSGPSLFTLIGSDFLIHLAGILALISFMAGYFAISLYAALPRTIYLYLALSMVGNLLYLPILINDGNMPIMALQIICFFAGMTKLITLAFGAAHLTRD